MRVVVTGATGNVGTSVVDALERSDQVTSVVAVARTPPGRPTTGAKVRWHAADLLVDDLEPILVDTDAVVHLAWMFHPTRDPLQTWRGNVGGTLRLLDAVEHAGVSAFVYASSIGAYSPLPPSDQPDRRVDESWPTHALATAAYGREKSYVERLLDTFECRVEGTRIVRIRSAFVFKRAAAPEQRRIFAGPYAPGRVIGSRRVPVIPVPRGIRLQAVHTDDLADAYVAGVVRPVSGAFNIAAEPVVGPDELARVLDARIVEIPANAVRAALAAAFHARLAPAPPALLDLFMSLPMLDTVRARRELDWVPQRSSLEALGEFLEGVRRPRGGETPRLAPNAGGPMRTHEISSGVGGRE